MFRIEEKNPLEQLRLLSANLGGDLREGRNAGLLEIDNHNGKGTIYSYEIIKGAFRQVLQCILFEGI